MQKRSPLGGFVKKDSRTGRWLRIKESEARDKVGHAIRKAIQRIEDTRPKTIERLKNEYAAAASSALLTQPASVPAPPSASSSQEGEDASSKTRSDQIKGGEPSKSDQSSTELRTLRGGGVPAIARHGDSAEHRENQSHPLPGLFSSTVLAGLGNAVLQQILLPPRLDLLSHRSSSRLLLASSLGGDPLSQTHMSRNFPPPPRLSSSTSQLVAQRLLAQQQNHHALLPGVPSPYDQSLLFGQHSSLRNGTSSSGQHSSFGSGRSMVGVVSERSAAKQARQDSMIIKVIQQQREQQESRRLKELEYARRLVMEGGLLPGLLTGIAHHQHASGGRHHQLVLVGGGGPSNNIPRMSSLKNATLQHQQSAEESRTKQEISSQTQHGEQHALLLGLLAASSQNKGDSKNQETLHQQRRG